MQAVQRGGSIRWAAAKGGHALRQRDDRAFIGILIMQYQQQIVEEADERRHLVREGAAQDLQDHGQGRPESVDAAARPARIHEDGQGAEETLAIGSDLLIAYPGADAVEDLCR